jgi:hypothetical protein
MLRRALPLLGFVLSWPSPARSEPVPLAAPSGRLGAGLGMEEAPTGRAWGEMGFHTQQAVTIVTPTLGMGLMVAPTVELELVVPLSFVSGDGHSAIGQGDLYFGVNYVRLDPSLRFKLGGGLSLPTAARDGDSGEANLLGLFVDAYQQSYYRIPDALGIVGPFRIEGGTTIVGSLDIDIALLISTGRRFSNNDAELIADFAPGIGGYATPQFLVGARAPLFWAITSSARDTAQIAIEPFLRGQIDSGFLDMRFTIPLDEPLGFAFERRKFWGLHLGGGAAF